MLAASSYATDKSPVNGRSSEQFIFNAEQYPPVRHPIHVPESVLKVLENDRTIQSCMKKFSLNSVPSSWLVASEIHLKGDDHSNPDLIVLPRLSGDNSGALHCPLTGAHISPFWVFQMNANELHLALMVSGDQLKVLSTKHHGYRDIESSAYFAGVIHNVIYLHENGKYRVYERKSEPLNRIGDSH